MASSYKSLKCDCCAGSMEYNREKKVWVCRYCGNEVRREEEYDGLFTIKNVVRQTLLDLAAGRMDNAEKNLTESEKIDSRYIGTQIARLAVDLFTVTTPGACAEGEKRSIFGRLKREYEALQSAGEGISSEEEALYEALEGSGDAFGVLLLTFDSLGAAAHRDFVEPLLNADAVYSRSLNDLLLGYFLKNGKTDRADQVLGNFENLDCKAAFFRVLSGYPDGAGKRAQIAALCPKAGLQPDDRPRGEDYLQKTADCAETKRAVFTAMSAAGAGASVQIVLRTLLPESEDDAEILDAVIEQHPSDPEVLALLEFLLTKCEAGRAAADLTRMQKLFAVLPVRVVLDMLAREDLKPEEKTGLLDCCAGFHLDARAYDALLAAYLCGDGGSPEERLQVLPSLLARVQTISTPTMERYVLTCSRDGEKKPDVLALLFGLPLNLSFFHDLLKKYMASCPDSPDVRTEVIRVLGEQGLQADPGILLRAACSAKDDAAAEDAARLIEKGVQNGARLPASALSDYLERCAAPRPLLIGMLRTPGARLTPAALARYVLESPEGMEVKAPCAATFAEAMGEPFGSTPCRVRHLGRNVGCNLLQACVLTAAETGTGPLVPLMLQAKVKLNPPVTADGEQMPFKKYIQAHRAELSEETLALCTENKVFSLFF